MITFPNAKINLGLDIIARRRDGYHDISTVMVAVDWTDILEVVPAKDFVTKLHISGRPVDCPPEKNLVMKAFRALEDKVGSQLPPVDIYLEKLIPDGAGLGGGSADAAFALKAFNEVLDLGLDKRNLAEVAATVGADCPFFIYNEPALCTGTGTTLRHISIGALDGKTILVAKPRAASVSTREAYAGVTPHPSRESIEEILKLPAEKWTGRLKNDFEASVFPLAPGAREAKEIIISGGSLYASMSGSGSAVYGIFENDKMAQLTAKKLFDCDCHVCHTIATP